MILKLKAKQAETSDAISFIFDAPAELTWQAGQYMIYKLPHDHPDDRKDRRFFTIAEAPFQREIRITTRFNPKGSSFKRTLHDLKIGNEIEAIKVGGDFVMEDPASQHIFVAGGIGITPYRAILKQLDYDGQPVNVTLLYANRTDEFVFKGELEELAQKHSEFTIQYFIDPQIIDEAVLKKYAEGEATIWLSGPEPMVEGMEQTLKKLNVPAERIKTDFFPGYTWP